METKNANETSEDITAIVVKSSTSPYKDECTGHQPELPEVEEQLPMTEMHQTDTSEPTDATEKGNIKKETPTIDINAVVITNQ